MCLLKLLDTFNKFINLNMLLQRNNWLKCTTKSFVTNSKHMWEICVQIVSLFIFTTVDEFTNETIIYNDVILIFTVDYLTIWGYNSKNIFLQILMLKAKKKIEHIIYFQIMMPERKCPVDKNLFYWLYNIHI